MTPVKGTIKIGAGVFHDHHFGKWPNCLPPRHEYKNEKYQYEAKNPLMIFDVEWTGSHWDCRAPGYGVIGDYGNGSIFVKDRDGVLLI